MFDPVDDMKYEMIVTDRWSSKASQPFYSKTPYNIFDRRSQTGMMVATQLVIYMRDILRNRMFGGILGEGMM